MLNENSVSLSITSQFPQNNLVENDDIIALILIGDKLLSAINTRDNKGIIKVWDTSSSGYHLLYEFEAHSWPIHHMTNGRGSEFFTSASDCTIFHWVLGNGDGTNCKCDLLGVLSPITMTEPAWRLKYDDEENRLYSGDGNGEVRIWDERDSLIGIVRTGEEVWDMLIENGVLYTTRNIDVNLTTLRNSKNSKITWSTQNIIEGTGPLCIQKEKICLMSKSGYKILVHSLEEKGNPCLSALEGHEAIITSIVSFPKRKLIFSGGYDGKVIAWNLNTFEKVGEVLLKGYITAMVGNEENETIFIGGQDRFICAIKVLER